MTQPMIVMGLMWQPEGLIVKIVLARGAERKLTPPPFLYIADPRGQVSSLSLMMNIFSLLS